MDLFNSAEKKALKSLTNPSLCAFRESLSRFCCESSFHLLSFSFYFSRNVKLVTLQTLTCFVGKARKSWGIFGYKVTFCREKFLLKSFLEEEREEQREKHHKRDINLLLTFFCKAFSFFLYFCLRQQNVPICEVSIYGHCLSSSLRPQSVSVWHESVLWREFWAWCEVVGWKKKIQRIWNFN